MGRKRDDQAISNTGTRYSSLGRALGIEIQGAETEPWSLLFHYTGNYFSHCVTDALSY